MINANTANTLAGEYTAAKTAEAVAAATVFCEETISKMVEERAKVGGHAISLVIPKNVDPYKVRDILTANGFKYRARYATTREIQVQW